MVCLPPVYRLRHYPAVDDVVLEARRLAETGAEEGTLVWADRQTAGRDQLGRPIDSPPDNLYCAIVLRPDFAARQAPEINFVTALATGSALAESLTSPVTLRYRWPDEVVFGVQRVATVRLLAPPARGDTLPWLVAAVNVNVTTADNPEDATSVRATDSDAELTPARLVEYFARQFLNWINRWADLGFAAILERWTRSADGLKEPRQLRFGQHEWYGVQTRVEADGALILTDTAGAERRISVAEFHGLAR